MKVATIHEREDEWPILWRRACGCRVTQDHRGWFYAVTDDPEPGASRATLGPLASESVAALRAIDRCTHR